MYYLYMLLCEGDLIYTGIAKDVKKRLGEHLGMQRGGAKFTRAHRPKRLLCLFSLPDRALASSAENRVKRLSRVQKERLVHSPEQVFCELFADLSDVISYCDPAEINREFFQNQP